MIETISIEPAEKAPSQSPGLSKEWADFLESLPDYEIQVLKIILKQVKVKSAIKKIAEKNITMPNLLIDSINERAADTIGELIISTSNDIPEIYEEYKENVQEMIAIAEEVKSKQPSN